MLTWPKASIIALVGDNLITEREFLAGFKYVGHRGFP
jgi:hypothetical protein